jgi:predicted DNA-binding protein with PD1-like motif
MASHPTQDIEAAAARHLHVEQENAGRVRVRGEVRHHVLEECNRLIAVARRDIEVFQPGECELAFDEFPVVRVVVCNQNHWECVRKGHGKRAASLKTQQRDETEPERVVRFLGSAPRSFGAHFGLTIQFLQEGTERNGDGPNSRGAFPQFDSESNGLGEGGAFCVSWVMTSLHRFVFLVVSLAVLGAAPLLRAAETRTEVVKPTTPADDAKANSASVPDVTAVSGKFDRVVILRFKHQADLLAGLERMVKEQKIKNAVILGAIGSVRSYHYHTVSNRTFPSKNLYVKDTEGTADIIGMSGFVMNGRVHPHITFANPEHTFGGHLEDGTTVFTFAAITIGVLPDDVDISRLDDKTLR